MDFQTRYEFNPKVDLLGKGGFSKVYKANDTLLERIVALKFFTANGSDKYQVLNEIKKVIRFEHPNLCKYYDVAVLSSKNIMGEVERVEVGIMEYLDAGDFKAFTKKNPQYIDKLLIDILKGLAYLHKRGIVHRDLKPQNILIKLVDDEPIAKITDFGISKLIDAEDHNSSALMGTIEYMAPEQFNPKRYGINGRIATNLDLWSFGLLLYETINHKPLFGSRSTGTSAEQVMSNILSDYSLSKIEDLPYKYREVVKKCLVKDASLRVQNALELIPYLENQTITNDKIILSKHEVFSEDTQVIEPPKHEVFSEDTQVIEPPKHEVFSEDTQVIEPPKHEVFSEDTQVIEPPKHEVFSEDTQVIEPPKHEVFSEDTQVIEPPKHEVFSEDTQVIEPKSFEKKNTLLSPNPVLNNRRFEKVKNKKLTLRNVLLVSAIPVLVIIVIFSSEILSSDKKIPPPPPPQQETFKKPVMEKIVGFKSTEGVEKSFEIGKYEIKVEQFEDFINETNYRTTADSIGKSAIYDIDSNKWVDSLGVNWKYNAYGQLIDESNKHLPVVHVSWIDANKYCEWLSSKGFGLFRLPTEKEWEYAAKGGKSTKEYKFSGSNEPNEVSWFLKNSNRTIHPVGLKKSNELGIHDMSGNVAEWSNTKDNSDENYRIVKGGSSFDDIDNLNKKVRILYNNSGGRLGFRVYGELR